ncbi:MAG: selenide, water dikinase SelD, partial [Paracoccaceae bacterium]
VLSGPGDDAAILRSGDALQVMTTDHLRAFTSDPHVMARITATHALGDIWAMGATPQVALSQIILPPLAAPLQSALLSDIMSAAAATFAAAGAEIVGGHTSIGTELSIGFTVTGTAARVITKAGARPGDALILTKSLGTGIILAAEMARATAPHLILGEIHTHALARMQHPLGPAAAILTPHAHAMTDVTGFGLAGHLTEILRASNCAATLTLDAIPLLPGALALSAAGQASSLAPANRAALHGRITDDTRAEIALLYDPQTAGGLLASVPADLAPDLLTRLRNAGDDAAIIGHITPGAPFITLA